MKNNATAETKQMEMIYVGSNSPTRYLPMTEFVDHDDFEDEDVIEWEEWEA